MEQVPGRGRWRRLSAIALLGAAALVVLLLLLPEPAGRVATLSDPQTPAGKATVGGVEAEQGAYPGVVAVAWADVHDPFAAQHCAGTVIDPRWVLTAAHCVEDAEAADLVVLEGSVDLLDPQLRRLEVHELHPHPDYTGGTGLAHDLALLRLAERAEVDPIEVAGHRRWHVAASEGRLLGWGGLGFDERHQVYPEVLIELPLTIVDDATCATALGVEHVPDAHFCAGDPAPEGGRDACRGDSGGPLLVPDGDGAVQVGVVSFGETCGMTYTAYTDVAAHCESFLAATVAGLVCRG